MERLPFRVVVAGSRSIRDEALIYTKLDTILGNKIKTHDIRIISGCAAGPDTIGARWAYERCLRVDKVPADWDKFGRSAGMIRNKIMLEVADAVIAFHDGASPGTANMIDITRAAKKPLRIVVVAQ